MRNLSLISHSHRVTAIFCVYLCSLIKWQLSSNHCKYATLMSCTSRNWEFSPWFLCYPSVDRNRQQGLNAVYFSCATTLLLGYEWKILQILAILPDCTWCSMLPSDKRRSYRHWVCLFLWITLQNNLAGVKCCQCHCVMFHTVEVQKTRVLLLSSTVLYLWWSKKIPSTWSCAVQQKLCSEKFKISRNRRLPWSFGNPLIANSFLCNPFCNWETRSNFEYFISFSCSTPQNYIRWGTNSLFCECCTLWSLIPSLPLCMHKH